MEKKHTVKGIKKPKDEISQEKEAQITNISNEKECHFESCRYF